MEALQMFDNFSISSKISGKYYVDFIDDLNLLINNLATNDKAIFLIDAKVLDLFSLNFKEIVSNNRLILIEASEKNKTIDYCQSVIRKLLQLEVRKNNVLTAIGGGITQDIVAFISSVLFRGVEWIFLPTTLLAQCDSCIGSKSSINFDNYKNLIGTFKPPNYVYIYMGFLKTLTESEIRSGIGEMLHYFLTDGIVLAQEITEKIDDLIKEPKKLKYFIKNSLKIKKNIIEVDEFDESIRHIFNYGHTFGHAIEAITNYSIPHGQAITLGMDLANYLSFKLQMINYSSFDEMQKILLKNMPNYMPVGNYIEEFINAMSKDKKNKGNKIGFILTRGPGKVEKVFIENNEWLKNCIIEYFNKAALV
jgi:3-dehydroquinate synthase